MSINITHTEVLNPENLEKVSEYFLFEDLPQLRLKRIFKINNLIVGISLKEDSYFVMKNDGTILLKCEYIDNTCVKIDDKYHFYLFSDDKVFIKDAFDDYITLEVLSNGNILSKIIFIKKEKGWKIYDPKKLEYLFKDMFFVNIDILKQSANLHVIQLEDEFLTLETLDNNFFTFDLINKKIGISLYNDKSKFIYYFLDNSKKIVYFNGTKLFILPENIDLFYLNIIDSLIIKDNEQYTFFSLKLRKSVGSIPNCFEIYIVNSNIVLKNNLVIKIFNSDFGLVFQDDMCIDFKFSNLILDDKNNIDFKNDTCIIKEEKIADNIYTYEIDSNTSFLIKNKYDIYTCIFSNLFYKELNQFASRRHSHLTLSADGLFGIKDFLPCIYVDFKIIHIPYKSKITKFLIAKKFDGKDELFFFENGKKLNLPDILTAISDIIYIKLDNKYIELLKFGNQYSFYSDEFKQLNSVKMKNLFKADTISFYISTNNHLKNEPLKPLNSDVLTYDFLDYSHDTNIEFLTENVQTIVSRQNLITLLFENSIL